MGMGFATKGKNKSSSSNSSTSTSEGWGMGFLLVLFPEEEDHDHRNQESKKKQLNTFNPFSSSLGRTNSNNLFHRAQSTIYICLLLLFVSLLLFTISTLPSSTTSAAAARRIYGVPARRQLHPRVIKDQFPISTSNLSRALQGMGTLYRRGTRAMNDLIVAHAVESLTLHDFKLFLRLFYRSSLTPRSDLLFIFPSKTVAFDNAIREENESFLKLVTQYIENLSNNPSSHSTASFELTQFVKTSKKQNNIGEPIWGRRTRSNSSDKNSTELIRLSYGSVVSFDIEELDPENSLSGFLDHVPMSLRRWACYPMLLGRVKRNFKHVLLVDIQDMLLLGDPMTRLRNQSPESILLQFTQSGKHGKKSSDKTSQHKPVHPGIIMGGARGIRKLSNAMLNEIARAAMQHKKKNTIAELVLFNQLIANEFILKNTNLIVATELLPELSSLTGLNSKSGSHFFISNHTLIRRGSGNFDVTSIVMKHICSFPLDSTVYSDC